jgi:hypothetical protein
MGAFARQFRALAWKNVLVLAQHPLVRALLARFRPDANDGARS